jgi:hypothetical protein
MTSQINPLIEMVFILCAIEDNKATIAARVRKIQAAPHVLHGAANRLAKRTMPSTMTGYCGYAVVPAG